MKKGLLIFILFTFSGFFPASGAVLPPPSSGAEISKWVDSRFSKGAEPPFSFELDGVPSSKFIRTWSVKRETLPSDEGVIARRFTYSDPRGGLRIVCDVKAYPEFNAVEWVLKVKNPGKKNSARITAFKSADVRLTFAKEGGFNMNYAEGNKISKSDYSPRIRPIEAGSPFHLSPSSGRSSEEAFPFFNLENEGAGAGAIVAIGWTGTWAADIEKKDAKSLSFRMGMDNFDLFLYPGEEIRTPSVAFLFWTGDKTDSYNSFRRLVIKHHSRTVDGKVDYPLCSGFNYRDPYPFSEYSAITADWAVAMIERYARFELLPDVFWLDAGWHTGAADYRNGRSWANTTGNWTLDEERFPNGLNPISEAAHKYGARFMVWFEPERVVHGTQWYVDHKDWMLEATWPEGSEESTWSLFDLGNDEACDWLCRYYGDFIEKNGIDYYRQDFNVKPAKYWAENDDPLRKGMKEIRHIENLYRFWDYLLERFPGLLIDNCASGGKRLDWETIGRSAPLWRSDYYHYDDPDGYQCHTYGLNYYLPVHGTGILLPDKYSFRSSLSSALIYNWKITEGGLNIIEMQERIKEYRSIKPYYYEDYYPLSGTGDLTGTDIWLAYELHRPSDDSGIVVAFRREDCVESDYEVALRGLSADSSYEILDTDSGRTEVRTGCELAAGLVLHLDTPKSSLLLKFTRKN